MPENEPVQAEEEVEETPEVEEEEEIVDPLPGLREQCTEEHCQKFKDMLDACNDRVNNDGAKESCHEEMIDFMHCVDHCAMPRLFKILK